MIRSSRKLSRLNLVASFLGIFLILIGPVSCSKRDDGDSFPRPMEVDDSNVRFPSGETAVLRGLNAFPPVWQAAGHDPNVGKWEEKTFRVMKQWGADIIRIPVHPGVMRKEGVDYSFRILDEAIQWARKYEMYVILDFHSIGFPPQERYLDETHFYYGQYYETSSEEITRFWEKASKRYAGNDVVAFYELFNEPVVSPNNYPSDVTVNQWKNLRSFMEDLIDKIRLNDQKTPVIVGGLRFGYDLSFVEEYPIRRNNVVYATHPYPGKQWKVPWDQAFGRISRNQAVFVTEFGFDTKDGSSTFYEGNYKGNGSYRDEIINYLEKKDIGWTAWSFSHVFEPTLLRDTKFKPTPSGQFFKRKLSTKP